MMSLAFICNNEMGHMCPLDSASAFTLHGLSSPSTSCAGAASCKFFEDQNADLEVFLLWRVLRAISLAWIHRGNFLAGAMQLGGYCNLACTHQFAANESKSWSFFPQHQGKESKSLNKPLSFFPLHRGKMSKCNMFLIL